MMDEKKRELNSAYGAIEQLQEEIEKLKYQLHDAELTVRILETQIACCQSRQCKLQTELWETQNDNDDLLYRLEFLESFRVYTLFGLKCAIRKMRDNDVMCDSEKMIETLGKYRCYLDYFRNYNHSIF